MPLTVGFDLDMTLVDSREGIVATLRATLAEAGHEVAEADVWPHVGIPLEDTIERLLPGAAPERVLALADRYRELYPELGVPSTRLLPGAREALTAIRAHGGRVVVVSAKVHPAVVAVLEHVGLLGDEGLVDETVGGLFAEAKGEALRARGVTAYVGDHPGDVAGARTAGAAAVAVATGPHPPEALADADVVLEDLTGLPAWLDQHLLDLRLSDLERRLSELDRVVVAFSGGADSAFVLAAAVRALGPGRVTAATAVSASLATGELDQAAEFAAGLGVRHLTPATDEMSREGYQANAGDRCFFCKAELLDVLGPVGEELGATVLTGTNADDARAGFRPGIRAAHERGAVAPLLEAGLTKAQVRAASRRWGLATWDKPAAACLSSRVAYGVRITPAALARVDRAEAAVRAVLQGDGRGVTDLRVRDLGEGRARVELDAAALASLADVPALQEAVLDTVRQAGFDVAEVDPRGFRSGAMNELLAEPDRYR